ncbi:MAG: cyclopropane-fatty-acyl-phospholipid synthase family protein [Pseudomonadota bacterium]
MNSTTAPTTFAIPQGTPAAARSVLRLLRKLRHGTLTLQFPDGSMQRFGNGGDQPHATLNLHNWNVCAAALKSGDIGFAESFIAGDWSTPNLVDLLRVLVKNRAEVESVVYGTWVGRLLYRIKHLMNRNTRSNAQKNVHAHYDLGNAFYRLWLDETMNYSSAWFNGDLNQPMAQAQRAKVRRALDEARVKKGDRVLEIGCGWGALAEMATVERHAHVIGVTLSKEQLASARERLRRLRVPTPSDAGPRHGTASAPLGSAANTRAGLGTSCDLRLQDYRDINDAPFDAICSIEMVEAVGREYWPTYFATVSKLLKPGGRACVQSIVINDALFDRYVESTDFIQQYIFPGGCLPCPREFRRQAEAAGLEVVQELAFGHDYAETLKRWRESFMAQRAQVLKTGFDARFLHIWEFYLAYCEAAFMEDNVDVVQYTLLKPAA